MGERKEIWRYMSKYKTEKIKSRNLSEKKRRDQFNMLINELSTMVCPTSRKMDKSSILRATISFLKNHTELSVQTQNIEVQENWKPPFLSNEEFTHLMLEALDGFIIVFSSNGKILYSSESTASLLGYLPSRLYSSVFDIIHEVDKSSLYKLISSATNSSNNSKDTFMSLLLHMKRGPIHSEDNNSYELVNLVGTFYHWPSNIESSNPSVFDCDSNSCSSISSPLPSAGVEWRSCFIAIGRLQTPHLLRVVNLPDDTKNEFTSRHSLEWKFLFLDHRAPPIIGYLPFEVLGTSGYDYYHVDDLDNIAASHELLLQTGEGTSCFYRFLTKGQQWIWLQTRYFISYHQWNSKPEFIVCTHTVVSAEKVVKSMQDAPKRCASNKITQQPPTNTSLSQSTCISPSPSVSSLGSLSSDHSEQCSTKTGSSITRANTVLFQNHGNKEKVPSSPLTRVAPALHTTPLHQDTFLEPHPHLMNNTPTSQSSDLNIISSADNVLPSTTTCELQVYVPASSSYSTVPASSNIIISTNVSGSQFQGERIQPSSSEDIQYLSQRYQMLQQTILQQQEELKRVSQQLRMAQFISPVGCNPDEISYEPTSDISSVSNYVNMYSVPSSAHMLTSIPVSAENIKSIDSYTQSTQSFITSRSYHNLEAELCSVGTSNGLPLLSSEQNNDVISQSYSMTHSMQPNL